MCLLDGKISLLFLSYFIYNHGLLSFLLKQGSTLFLCVHPHKFQNYFFWQEISTEGKAAPVLLCPILKEEMELKSWISRDLPMLRSVCDRNEETYMGGVTMKMKKSL